MANQRTITLYDVSATPTTVILNSLPVADTPTGSVCYLYPVPQKPAPVGDNPGTITLYDVNATPSTITVRPVPNFWNVAANVIITLRSLTVPEGIPEAPPAEPPGDYYAILWRRISGAWQKAKLMLEIGGTGQAATLWVRVGGVPQSVDTIGV